MYNFYMEHDLFSETDTFLEGSSQFSLKKKFWQKPLLSVLKCLYSTLRFSSSPSLIHWLHSLLGLDTHASGWFELPFMKNCENIELTFEI